MRETVFDWILDQSTRVDSVPSDAARAIDNAVVRGTH